METAAGGDVQIAHRAERVADRRLLFGMDHQPAEFAAHRIAHGASLTCLHWHPGVAVWQEWNLLARTVRGDLRFRLSGAGKIEGDTALLRRIGCITQVQIEYRAGRVARRRIARKERRPGAQAHADGRAGHLEFEIGDRVMAPIMDFRWNLEAAEHVLAKGSRRLGEYPELIAGGDAQEGQIERAALRADGIIKGAEAQCAIRLQVDPARVDGTERYSVAGSPAALVDDTAGRFAKAGCRELPPIRRRKIHGEQPAGIPVRAGAAQQA